MLTIEQYRESVITLVGCPECGAAVNHGCFTYAFRRRLATRYVHDARCMAYDEVRAWGQFEEVRRS